MMAALVRMELKVGSERTREEDGDEQAAWRVPAVVKQSGFVVAGPELASGHVFPIVARA